MKPETASRVRQRIEAVLDYAGARGWRSGENPARWRGHLANLLPAKSRVAPVRHHPAMPWQDLPDFLASLSRRQGIAAKAVTFIILTAARSGEARGARWAEIDMARAVWTVPANRMKSSREHRIPLAGTVIDLLGALRPDHPKGDRLVFPGAVEGKPLSDVALAKLLPSGTSVHGFRASFRTWAAEATDFSREAIELALAHRVGNSVEQAYARGDLFRKRAELMATWAQFCLSPPDQSGTAVVPLRSSAA